MATLANKMQISQEHSPSRNSAILKIQIKSAEIFRNQSANEKFYSHRIVMYLIEIFLSAILFWFIGKMHSFNC